jgi:hypothetical protein
MYDFSGSCISGTNQYFDMPVFVLSKIDPIYTDKICRHLCPSVFQQYALILGYFLLPNFSVFRECNCEKEINENPSEKTSREGFCYRMI